MAKKGWAFNGIGKDNEDSASIYDILETAIIPLYYDRDTDGLPTKWIRVMKEAIKSVAPKFSTRRMVKEYALIFYQDALKSALAAEKQTII